MSMSEYQSVLPGTTPLVAIALMDMAVSMVCGERTVRNKTIKANLSRKSITHISVMDNYQPQIKGFHTKEILWYSCEMWVISIANICQNIHIYYKVFFPTIGSFEGLI